MRGGREWIRNGARRTEDFPAFAEAFTVLGVDDVDDGVTVAVVPMPDVAYAPLAAQVPELEYRRRKDDGASYTQRVN